LEARRLEGYRGVDEKEELIVCQAVFLHALMVTVGERWQRVKRSRRRVEKRLTWRVDWWMSKDYVLVRILVPFIVVSRRQLTRDVGSIMTVMKGRH
jgi:hypothetical protein